ncbi:hypothetical protein [Rhodoferax sp. WC2427]|uniref:hypothetical protein n=1 Tax=Rhodoferax sp. WC2427 TaxID=3234144 RepID=UPI00346506AB
MKSAVTRAAIHRASQQARNAMQDLDAQQAAELLQIYEQAAQDVQALVASKANNGDLVPLERLQDLLRQVNDVIDALGHQRNTLMAQGLEQAAALGVQPYTPAAVAATGQAGAQAVLGSDAAMRVATDAVKFVLNFRAADGLQLSDRVWRLDQGAKEVLGRAINSAVVQGWDAQRAAAQFMYSGQPVPADVSARLQGGTVGQVARAADLLAGNDQAEVWKAARVFRTEANRAHGTAYMQGAAQTPGFVGFKYLLSPQHPKPDICDLLAAQNLYGLGQGVYPSADRCPWPAHPNTLSFVNIVFASDLTTADAAGKETVTDAMGRMPPDVREGILGQQKATLWDEGKLSQGMIRSPLYAVNKRLLRRA